MRWSIRLICVFVSLGMLAAARGQGADGVAERFFDVPGGGGIQYSLWENTDGREEAYGLSYSGSAKWLAEQKDARSHWHKISTLEEIELHMQALVTADQMAYIAGLKSVHTLSISEVVFEGRALAPLERMTGLRSLWIDCGSHLSRMESKVHDLRGYEYPRGEFFKFLDKLADLEVLALWPECDEATYVRVCGLKNLKWLNFGEFGKMSDENAAKIANLSKLECVSFPPLADATPFLAGLRGHSRLKELSIARASLDTADVEAIASITKLEQLSLQGERIGSLRSLGGLANLKKLALRFREIEASDGCRFLAGMGTLEEVVLLGLAENDFSLAHLRGSKNLKGLGVDAVLSVEDIAILESMPKLEELGVGNEAGSEWFKEAKRRLPKVRMNGDER